MGVIDPVKVTITNWTGGTEWVEVENNPEDESAGKRMIPFSGELWIENEDFREEANNKYHRLKLGGEVRLKGGYVIKAESVVKDSDGNITEILCTYDTLSKSGMTLDRKIKGTIHWVSVEHGINIPVNEYDRLFSVEIPSDDFLSELNPNSLVVNTKAVFEPHVLNVKEAVQMMRKGYYILDSDGKSFNKTVSLKEGWNG
jgi:glutaminyl-tRNA synthetase